jgi:protein-S-isoprenylcysteine O-methyltransferase Ste14
VTERYDQAMTRVPALGPRGEGWVVLQTVLLAGLGVAGLLGLAGAGGLLGAAWSGPARVATSALGLGLGLLGANQVRRGTRDLSANLTPLPFPSADAQLVETGIYAKVRHPIYGGIVLGGFGWALLTASPAVLALAAILVPFFWLKSSIEERWLEQRFAGYDAYRNRTRRFIAWLG